MFKIVFPEDTISKPQPLLFGGVRSILPRATSADPPGGTGRTCFFVRLTSVNSVGERHLAEPMRTVVGLDDGGQVIVAREDPSACPTCGVADLKQETDVLDTWFSSALWPFSTLGGPSVLTEDPPRLMFSI